MQLPPIVIGSTTLLPPTSTIKKSKRVKVNIEPGYSQLDWAKLKSSGADLRVSNSHSFSPLSLLTGG